MACTGSSPRRSATFLEHTNFSEEMAKVLTTLSFEIKTEVRFIPNDERLGAAPKPDIRAKVRVKSDSQHPPADPGRARGGQGVKSLSAGSEIDSWCTKCRMDLGHRIIAMVHGRPKRVICQTCGSQHNYRAPASETKAVVRRNAAPKPAGSAAQRVTQKAQAEAQRVHDWESRIAGQAMDAFTRYTIDKSYARGELVIHKKFGEGYVVDVLEAGKVSVMFRDGPRTLAQGQGS